MKHNINVAVFIAALEEAGWNVGDDGGDGSDNQRDEARRIVEAALDKAAEVGRWKP